MTEKNNISMKTAIMGGTFDPVHLGHMSFAMDVLEQTDIQKIVFMPAKLQPFKLDVKMSSFGDRAAMLRIACEVMNMELAGKNNGNMAQKSAEVSLLENELSGVSYTYRTLEEYKERYMSELYFITGADSYVKLDTWMQHEKLLRDNSFVVGVRPGYPEDEIYEKKAEYEEKFGTITLVIHNTPVDMSATQIRQAVSEGRDLEGMVTGRVADYIKQHRLYI